MACLSKSKAGRPESAEAFLAALRACDDVDEWSPDEARLWWKTNREMLEERSEKARDEAARTLAVAPRPTAP